ncbi:MAG: rod shape-determining protein RodA, partial [Candidatus Omnitrophica bacterium]|nr:rod shape-determining protein RodA [Candidatus Omnitrophota bacterium]
FQPSELSKLAVILMLARYFSQRRPRLSFDFKNSLRDFVEDLLWPFSLTGLSIFLIFKQPDLGTAIMVFGIFTVMLYMSGISSKVFAAFMLFLAACVPFGWHFLKPYQRDRLLVFIDPNHDPLGAGYTIIQSKIAVGSGQLLGKGWLAGSQNQLNFLPERHTDFIFSVVGEEWGLLGGALLVYCCAVLIACGLQIAVRNKDRFGQQAAIGIVGIFALQVIINIGMVMGLFPVVGITLPLVSYGRTSLIVFAVMFGFLLNLGKRRTMF